MSSRSGASTDTETVRLGLEARARQGAYERLRALRGSEPRASDVPRRREAVHARSQSDRRHDGARCTSVWIRFLAGRAPYANPLDGLLGRGEVTGHDSVYGELPIGGADGRRALLTDYAAMHRAPIASHTEVVAFVRATAPVWPWDWLDRPHLLASALVGHLRFWTADSRLGAVARELGISYD